jgi:hypothetical protein
MTCGNPLSRIIIAYSVMFYENDSETKLSLNILLYTYEYIQYMYSS